MNLFARSDRSDRCRGYVAAMPEPGRDGTRGLWRWLLVIGAASLVACGAEVDRVREGTLARVGDRNIDAEALAATQAQLGAYGQARFRGSLGQRALLETKMIEALLELEAIDAGLGDDPRVEWMLNEELATLQMAAELERRLPLEALARDSRAMQQEFASMHDRFRTDEQRSFRGVSFESIADAASALAQLRAGEVQLEDLGEIQSTRPASANFAEFPLFHRMLFAPEIGPGDWLAAPVLVGTKLMVGAVQTSTGDALRTLADPEVREAVLLGMRKRRNPALRLEILAELAERYPEQPP